MNRNKKTFGLFGASKTGLSIAWNMYKTGEYIPKYLWNRSETNLHKGADIIPFHKYSSDIDAFNYDVDWIIISVTDDAVEEVVNRICNNSPNLSITKIFHTSGMLNSNILRSLQKLGGKTGSFHPVCSIPNITDGIIQISKAIFTCEGEIQDDLIKIAGLIGKEGIPINNQQKKSIHISAVFLNNYLNGLIASIKKMNSDMGISFDNSQKILKQITTQTAETGWDKSISDSLTGPIKRGDFGTIEDHLKFLNNNEKIKSLYKDFGMLLLDFVDFKDISIKEKLEEKFMK